MALSSRGSVPGRKNLSLALKPLQVLCYQYNYFIINNMRVGSVG
jgi:hypothetical protein